MELANFFREQMRTFTKQVHQVIGKVYAADGIMFRVLYIFLERYFKKI